MEINELVNKIFNEGIKPEKSIQVSFDGIENSKELFEILITVFTEGMKIHFGKNEKVDLNILSLKEFEKIIKYFRSIGILLCFHKFHVKQLERMENEGVHENITYKYDIYNRNITNEYINSNYQDIPIPEYFINYKNVSSNILSDYKFQIRVSDNIYIIYFKFL